MSKTRYSRNDTAKKAQSKSRVATKAPFRFPGLTVALACLLAAAGIIFSLFLGNPANSSILGRAGTGLSSFLLGLFGLGAFWPAAVLVALGWLSFKGQVPELIFIRKVAGWALFLFAVTAFCSLVVPDTSSINPGGSAGGSFGLLLARAATEFMGSVGAGLMLPLIAALGFFTVWPGAWRKVRGLVVFTWPTFGPKTQSQEAQPVAVTTTRTELTPKLGLSVDPAVTTEPAQRTEPIIVVKKEPVIIESPPSPKATPATATESQQRRAQGPYVLPKIKLLDVPPPSATGHVSGLSREELMANAHLLESKLRDFGVEGIVQEVSGGPVITMYEYQPAPGIKISKVAGLSDDLTMAMRAISIRVVAPLLGKAAIGIEIPNPKRAMVSFREVIESPVFQNSTSPLSLVLGVDTMGSPVVADLAKMPHLLIAGATGSGKSVGLGAMIMSILYKATPEQVRFLMIDPKCVELALYKDIAHLIYPVLSDPTEATLGLKWAVAEMDMRYKLLAAKGVRNIEGYNEKIRAELLDWPKKSAQQSDSEQEQDQEPPRELPLLVIIIDELADLMMVAAKEVEVYITRLAQKARASGIHLILATQRPSVDVLTGVIKANMPTRISFQVSSRIDSRTILDQMGAEKLLGAGDMLFLPPGVGKLRRLHGAYVSDDEIKRVTDYIRQWGPAAYLDDLALPEAEGGEHGNGEKDEKYEEAVDLVRQSQRATISHVQRHLRIGYNRAARIIEDMERDGIIGPQDGTRPRVIF